MSICLLRVRIVGLHRDNEGSRVNLKATDIGFERFEEDFYADPNTMLIKAKSISDDENALDVSLSYNKTFEEEMEDLRKVTLAESYLKSLGVNVRTDMYGYYRLTYDILKDLGEYLSKKDV